MTAPVSGQLCSAWAELADLPTERPVLPDATWTELLLVASEILWALSGRRWSGGECEATATLYGERGWSCGAWHWTGTAPAVRGGSMLRLPHDEVTDVVSVTIGATPFTGWRRAGAWLQRLDARSWLSGSDVTVVYLWGLEPPAAGKRAAVAYALELGRAVADDDACRLPQRVVSVVRQGVSMTLIDPQQYLDQGRLGIPDIDQWLAAINPAGVPERATIWSPDLHRAR